MAIALATPKPFMVSAISLSNPVTGWSVSLLPDFNGGWLHKPKVHQHWQERRSETVKEALVFILRHSKYISSKTFLNASQVPRSSLSDVKDKAGDLPKMPPPLWQKWHLMKLHHQTPLYWRRIIRFWGPFVGLDTKPGCWFMFAEAWFQPVSRAAIPR